MDPPILYVDMDDVMCNFTESFIQAKQDRPGLDFPQSVPGFFLNLTPIENAIDSVNELRIHFNTYVLTAPSTRNAHCYTEKRLWIERHFGYPFTKRLIISPNKGLLIGDYLIDDHATGRGQDTFRGELIQFGTDAYPNWKTVVRYLNQKRSPKSINP